MELVITMIFFVQQKLGKGQQRGATVDDDRIAILDQFGGFFADQVFIVDHLHRF
ncbi:hypothetical protein D3C81_2074160 [compost metagenome]